MLIRCIAAVLTCAFVLVTSAVASATGTIVLTPLGGKPQTIPGARIVKKGESLVITASGNRSLVFEESSCINTTEIIQCQPISISYTIKGKKQQLNFEHGLLNGNLSRRPQPAPGVGQLPVRGIDIVLETDTGLKITVRGTIDAGFNP